MMQDAKKLGVNIPGYELGTVAAAGPGASKGSQAYSRTKESIPGLMQQLESLGYAHLKAPAGINCELRQYQEQSLKWCVDQEQLPGGMHRHLWARVLPGKADLWYRYSLHHASR